jgi:thiol-disulfide isomerase/thioredoxin
MTKIFLFLLLFISVFSESLNAQTRVRKGHWTGDLEIEENVLMPFRFYYNSKKQLLEVHNASEVVGLEFAGMSGDTALYNFSTYNSHLAIYKKSCGKVVGKFVNRDRKTQGVIPFEATFAGRKKKFKQTETTENISGKWQVSFAAFQDNEYPAIGLFEQDEKGRVTGTFMTETGDYRFLEGKMDGDRLILSGFSGGQVFYFDAKIVSGNLFGTFYSGKHYSNKWIAQRNEQFELTNPYEKTFRVTNEPLTFKKPDLEGKDYEFPNASTSGKVVIIQILGSWCPNCLDETVFLRDLYNSYSGEGLEIIALGYEIPETYEGQRDRLIRYVEKAKVPYTVLVGGKVSKAETAKDFPMLNDIYSYPTTIFINRAGEVVQIHTGFNGPGTGEVYEQYVIETEKLIQKLLNE